ncbi:MAG: Tol-Pal system protein TolB, partial [Novosphingobium sp.]|nr:Tol-Pal system protein TolB [Novosphingobium sp.]
MIVRLFVSLAALAVAAPVMAQSVQPAMPAAPPAPEATAPADDGGLTGSVTDRSKWRDLGTATPAFATDREVPTPAAGGTTTALGKQIANVIDSDLRNNGLFKPTGPDALPAVSFGEVPAPAFDAWRARSAEMLLQGFVKAGEGGQLTVGCYL